MDRQSKWVLAHVVPKQGHDAHAIKSVSRGIRFSRYKVVIFDTDQESPIFALLEAAKLERAEAARSKKEETKIGNQIVAEESPL